MQCGTTQQREGGNFVINGMALLWALRWAGMMLQDSKKAAQPHQQPTTDGRIKAGCQSLCSLTTAPIGVADSDAHSRSTHSPTWSMLRHTICSTRNATPTMHPAHRALDRPCRPLLPCHAMPEALTPSFLTPSFLHPHSHTLILTTSFSHPHSFTLIPTPLVT